MFDVFRCEGELIDLRNELDENVRAAVDKVMLSL